MKHKDLDEIEKLSEFIAQAREKMEKELERLKKFESGGEQNVHPLICFFCHNSRFYIALSLFLSFISLYLFHLLAHRHLCSPVNHDELMKLRSLY
jgi:hypothetical protein